MSAVPMGDARRNASSPQTRCPVCERSFGRIGRGVYCSPTCRQRAFRLRHQPVERGWLIDLADRLRQQHRLIDQTIYECPACEQRFLGQRRCGDCNLMCRKLGLGGACRGCDELVTLDELLDLNPQGGDAVA